MAIQKLIQGTFEGSAGTLTGQRWKDKKVVKQKIWSKTPASPAQKSSVRSFECLNRLSSAIAKAWWYKLGLSNAKMHKHNAVAKLLAPVVANHTFDPSAIEEVFKADGTGKIDAYTFDPETNLLEFSASTTLDVSAASGNSWLVAAFSVTGEVFLCESPAAATITRSLFVPVPADTEPYVLVLTTQKDRKRVRYGGFALKPSIAVFDVVLSNLATTYNESTRALVVTADTAPALPAGSYTLQTAVRSVLQGSFKTTDREAAATVDADGKLTLVLAAEFDALNQREQFPSGAYIAIEEDKIRTSEGIYQWQRAEHTPALAVQTQSYDLSNLYLPLENGKYNWTIAENVDTATPAHTIFYFNSYNVEHDDTYSSVDIAATPSIVNGSLVFEGVANYPLYNGQRTQGYLSLPVTMTINGVQYTFSDETPVFAQPYADEYVNEVTHFGMYVTFSEDTFEGNIICSVNMDTAPDWYATDKPQIWAQADPTMSSVGWFTSPYYTVETINPYQYGELSYATMFHADDTQDYAYFKGGTRIRLPEMSQVQVNPEPLQNFTLKTIIKAGVWQVDQYEGGNAYWVSA